MVSWRACAPYQHVRVKLSRQKISYYEFDDLFKLKRRQKVKEEHGKSFNAC